MVFIRVLCTCVDIVVDPLHRLCLNPRNQAYHYARRHLEISKETGDRMGQATAQVNLSELAKNLGFADGQVPADYLRSSPDMGKRRMSMENMEVIKLTPDAKKVLGTKPKEPTTQKSPEHDLNKSDLLDDEEDFFDFITRFQSKRMDDQRCSLAEPAEEQQPVIGNRPPGGDNNLVARPGNKPCPRQAVTKHKEDLLDMIAGAQGSRMNEQRSGVGGAFLPGLPRSKQPEVLQRLSVAAPDKDSVPDDSFFEQLMKMQGTRIEDQRSSLPADEEELHENGGGVLQDVVPGVAAPVAAPTMPDEDFFSLICRLQGGRIDDQRAHLPGGGNWPDRENGGGGGQPTENGGEHINNLPKTSDL